MNGNGVGRRHGRRRSCQSCVIMSALLFIAHGTQKLFVFPASDRGMPPLVSIYGLATSSRPTAAFCC